MKKEETEKGGVGEMVIKLIAKPAGLHALKQFAQDILNAVEEYEKNIKKELAKEDGE